MHNARMRATGSLDKTKWGTPEERFWAKVNKNGPVPTKGHTPTEGPCWLWLGAMDGKGYGQMRLGGRSDGALYPAHHIAWVLSGGDLPPGLELDHRCRVRGCVNVMHLQLLAHAANAKLAQHLRQP